MLYGAWEKDLDARVRLQIGNVRREAYSSPDMSSNILRSVVSQLSVLYDTPPFITGPPLLVASVSAAGLYSLMCRVQRDTLGLREMLLRVDIANDGGLTFRPVFPDLVIAESYPDRPGEPIAIREARQRDGRWTWDVLDIRDGGSYRVLAMDGSDLSGEYLPGVTSYPYIDQAGRPYLPYSMFHAAESATLWDPYEARELVEGSLNCAVLWSFFAHCTRAASWPQRWAVGVEVPAAGYYDEDSDGVGRTEVVTDPATVLMLRAAEEGIGGQPMVGQWQPGADPAVLQEAIAAYERRVATYAGISGSSILRKSGDPRSGYALSVSREAQREAQRRYEPMFRRGDLATLRICAALLGLSSEGIAIEYAGVPLSLEEQKERRESLLAEMAAGLIDRVEAYQRVHPELSREQAQARLVEIASFEQVLDAPTAGKAQDTALNGAQVVAAQEIVLAVARGELPRDSGIGMLQSFFNMTEDQALAVMGTVGAGFSAPSEEASK
tara:strand:+ start:1902 stop:3389 length:1488 start_codon:yes stop_codon:yes gene_type:complete